MGLFDFLKRKPEPLPETGTEMEDNARSIITAHASRPNLLIGFGAAMFYLQQDLARNGDFDLLAVLAAAPVTVERAQGVMRAQQILMKIQEVAGSEFDELSEPRRPDEQENRYKLRSYNAIAAQTRSHAAQVWLFIVVAHYAGDERNKLRAALAQVWTPLREVAADQLGTWADIYQNTYLRGDDYTPDFAKWAAIGRLAEPA